MWKKAIYFVTPLIGLLLFAGRPTSAQTRSLSQRLSQVESRLDRLVDLQEAFLPTFAPIAAGEIDALLQEIDDEAKGIIEAQARVAPDLKQYREALLKAPDVFRKLADSMDERAGKRKAIVLKEAYADISAEARKLATVYETKAKQIDKLEADLQEKVGESSSPGESAIVSNV